MYKTKNFCEFFKKISFNDTFDSVKLKCLKDSLFASFVILPEKNMLCECELKKVRITDCDFFCINDLKTFIKILSTLNDEFSLEFEKDLEEEKKPYALILKSGKKTVKWILADESSIKNSANKTKDPQDKILIELDSELMDLFLKAYSFSIKEDFYVYRSDNSRLAILFGDMDMISENSYVYETDAIAEQEFAHLKFQLKLFRNIILLNSDIENKSFWVSPLARMAGFRFENDLFKLNYYIISKKNV